MGQGRLSNLDYSLLFVMVGIVTLLIVTVANLLAYLFRRFFLDRFIKNRHQNNFLSIFCFYQLSTFFFPWNIYYLYIVMAVNMGILEVWPYIFKKKEEPNKFNLDDPGIN